LGSPAPPRAISTSWLRRSSLCFRSISKGTQVCSAFSASETVSIRTSSLAGALPDQLEGHARVRGQGDVLGREQERRRRELGLALGHQRDLQRLLEHLRPRLAQVDADVLHAGARERQEVDFLPADRRPGCA
jgi:hypothetical protein